MGRMWGFMTHACMPGPIERAGLVGWSEFALQMSVPCCRRRRLRPAESPAGTDQGTARAAAEGTV